MPEQNYNIQTLLEQFGQQTADWLHRHAITNPLIVGIHTAGVWLAHDLHRRLGLSEPVGEINPTFYRDDFHTTGLHRQKRPSSIPFSVENRHVLLVDDVLYTGRTLRGAMNELFDYGRPASIIAAVLIAREGRELPIEPQIAVLREEPGKHYRYRLSGPEPLSLQLVESV